MFCTNGQIAFSLLAFTSFYLHGSIAVIAYDAQIYSSCSPSHVDDLSPTLSGCVNDVVDWMQTNQFQLNPGKMELLWCTTSRRQNRLPTATLTVDSPTVSQVSSVRDLGIFIDSEQVMHTLSVACLTTSRTRSSAYTGYECPKGSCSRSQCRLNGHCMVMLLNTYGSLHQSPTFRLDKDFGLQPRMICAFLLSDCLL